MSDGIPLSSGGSLALYNSSITVRYFFYLYRRVQPTPLRGGEGYPRPPQGGVGLTLCRVGDRQKRGVPL